MLFVIIKCECIQPCKPGAEVYAHYIVHYSVFCVRVCVSARGSLLFPKTCPKHINRVKCCGEWLCLFAQRRITLQGVSSMCITSRGRQRGLIFLYPGLNYEEEELPCC